MAHHPFNESYIGTPPWDIGRPQPEFVRVAQEGGISGAVLDIGCGTGENAIFFAGIVPEVWGIDSAPLAIQKARKKALERNVSVKFDVGDALQLEGLKRKFDTITDCGLFHIFSDQERRLFVNSLRAGLSDAGTYFMLCFSDKEPTDWGGPRRVSKGEITDTFRRWKVNYIREARIYTTFHDEGGRGWLASVTRV